MKRLGVLISGRGSNLQALIDAAAEGRLTAEIAVVISNLAEAYGLERARMAGIEAITVSHRGWPSRADYDTALAMELRARSVDLVCLAGYMRIAGAPLLEAYPNAILNIHPSLLPSFPGLDAQSQALRHGVKVSGATVHLVDGGLDSGPIVMQKAVRVLDDDDESTLSARILAVEHEIYPAAVQTIVDGRWRVDGRRVVAV